MLLARLDEYGRPAWFAVTIVAFWIAWPLGFAVFAFLVGSGRLRAWKEASSPGRWFNLRETVGNVTGWPAFSPTGSGNDAFDVYRKAELDRLEDEQREFKVYLERLRRARDKAEFDQFMADLRKSKSGEPTAEVVAS